MSRYCVVCGRELTKTMGPVGPKCLQKIRPRNMRIRRISKAQFSASYDMYGGDNGQKENDETSEDSEGQEASQNGESG